jgi:histidinol-phosphatase (PHP family)
MIRSDNHVHTDFSSDSDATMESVVQQAQAKGLSSLCFTDHMDYNFPDLGNGMNFLFDTDLYFREIARLEKKYPAILLRRGIELGLKPDLENRCKTLTGSHPFDFVIGSTHLVDNADPYYPAYWENKTQKEGLLRYYEMTLENIAAISDYDVYGHIDYIVRYTPTQQKNRESGIIDENYMKQCYLDTADIIDEILRQLILSGKGIEVNTAGLRYDMGHTNPREEILKRYRELGGEIISVGSDSHAPQHLAFAFERIPHLLRSCGFRYYTEFHKRVPKMIPL